jgi:hypothetical protein
MPGSVVLKAAVDLLLEPSLESDFTLLEGKHRMPSLPFFTKAPSNKPMIIFYMKHIIH